MSKTKQSIVSSCRPARDLATQVSIDDCRRYELANILRDKECREMVRINITFSSVFCIFYFLQLIGQWMNLIEEKRETDLLDIVMRFNRAGMIILFLFILEKTFNFTIWYM